METAERGAIDRDLRPTARVRRRRGGHGASRHDPSAAAPDDAARFRGERLARAPNPAHRDPGVRRDAARGIADGATQRQFLEIIHRQAPRIGALVADLLTLCELQSRPNADVDRRDGEPREPGLELIESPREGRAR